MKTEHSVTVYGPKTSYNGKIVSIYDKKPSESVLSGLFSYLKLDPKEDYLKVIGKQVWFIYRKRITK